MNRGQQGQQGYHAYSPEGYAYVCQDRGCSAQFRRRDQLRRHYDTKHTKKAFRCDICGTSTSTRYHMNRHVRNVHRMEPERYAKCAPVEYPPNAFRLVRVAEPQAQLQLQVQDHSFDDDDDEENGVANIGLPPSPSSSVSVNGDEEVTSFNHSRPIPAAEDGALTAAAAVATLVVLTVAAAARPAPSAAAARSAPSAVAARPAPSAVAARPVPSAVAANPTPSAAAR